MIASVLVLGGATPAAAQGVVGQLYDFDTGAVVAAAEVVMINQAGDTIGRATSDVDGRFTIIADEPGNYSLLVSRLGYVSEMSANVKLEAEAIQTVEIAVHADAVAIEGLVVRTAPMVEALNKLGFYERKKSGRGNFVLPSETEKIQAFSASGLLRSVPGITVREGIVRSVRRAIQGPNLETRPCALKVLVNGSDMGIDLDRAVKRRDVSAIEVYNSLRSVPAEYLGSASSGYVTSQLREIQSDDSRGRIRRYVTERTCGVVLVWTLFGRGGR